MKKLKLLKSKNYNNAAFDYAQAAGSGAMMTEQVRGSGG